MSRSGTASASVSTAVSASLPLITSAAGRISPRSAARSIVPVRQVGSLVERYEKPPLERVLAQYIAAKGPISVAEFMHQCLTHPDYGYYAQKDPFGPCGDFVTAPEISQLFGELVAVWIAHEFLENARNKRKITLIELGPGRGLLMKDIIATLSKLKAMNGVQKEIVLLESSAKLQSLQKSQLVPKVDVKWATDIKEITSELVNPFFIANEFFDAIPIQIFEKDGSDWRQLLVEYDHIKGQKHKQSSLSSWHSSPSSIDRLNMQAETAQSPSFHLVKSKSASVFSKISKFFDKLPHDLPNHSRIEVSFQSHDILNQICKHLMASSDGGGGALIIDYGPSNHFPANTFRAIERHKVTSPFDNIGKCDLTADIDFHTFKNIAQEAGLFAHGPVEQAQWLLSMGLSERVNSVLAHTQNEKECAALNAAANRLVDCGLNGMGKLYKVLALTKFPKCTAM